MQNRGLGDSAASVCSKMENVQIDRWLKAKLQYLGDYENNKQGRKKTCTLSMSHFNFHHHRQLLGVESGCQPHISRTFFKDRMV